MNKLWTRDFTILTLGSVVSMLGNAMSGFAMSLLVLDYTQSALLYAVYVAVFTLPQVIAPVFSGAILDRFSRKKTIYTLDFLSAALYASAAFVISSRWFSFPILAVYCFLVGCINSVYTVAYQSFYPLLVSEGNYSKAYSISSVLETVAAVMIPVSTFAYNQVGITPLLLINAGCFFIAAVMETQIRAKEDYIALQKQNVTAQSSGRQLLRDIREGFSYLSAERGLLAVALYFTASALAAGASAVTTLPYFKSTFENGEYVYMLVVGMMVVGRAVGGLVQYRVRLPAAAKFGIALGVYLVTNVLEATYLFTPIPVMMTFCFLSGLMGVTSYTIRVSATQSYVPHEKKGRFNGAFNMLNTVGSLAGQLLAGGLGTVLPARLVLLIFFGLNAAAALTFIGGGRRHVRPIFNLDR
ncbi:MAG: MFS transporter [Oscillospiraceae bacterium]|nr:MFS transporter [Oscillospiraceae bacterium]